VCYGLAGSKVAMKFHGGFTEPKNSA